MRNRIHTPRISLRHKFILTYAAVTLAAVLAAEGITLGVTALIVRQSLSTITVWGLPATLLPLAAALVGLLLGTWACGRVANRLQRALKASRAWLSRPPPSGFIAKIPMPCCRAASSAWRTKQG